MSWTENMTSKATKRKHVIKEVLDDFVLPEDGQEIVKVMSSCGNNLHQVGVCVSYQYSVIMLIYITMWHGTSMYIESGEL